MAYSAAQEFFLYAPAPWPDVHVYAGSMAQRIEVCVVLALLAGLAQLGVSLAPASDEAQSRDHAVYIDEQDVRSALSSDERPVPPQQPVRGLSFRSGSCSRYRYDMIFGVRKPGEARQATAGVTAEVGFTPASMALCSRF